jgi:hypothetical protein
MVLGLGPKVLSCVGLILICHNVTPEVYGIWPEGLCKMSALSLYRERMSEGVAEGKASWKFECPPFCQINSALFK